MSRKFDELMESGLIGCLNDTGINSRNYKEQQMKWIELEKQSPKNNEVVLCCDVFNKFVSLGRFLSNEDEFELMFMDKVEFDSIITHWMPLPSLEGIE